MSQKYRMSNPDLHSLRDALDRVPPGQVSPQILDKILGLLAKCWPSFVGSELSAMDARKLHRAESLSWHAPVVSFIVERHGAIVQGSTRAELQGWQVNLETGSARCESNGYRQLSPKAKSLDVKPIARCVCTAAMQGPASSCDLVRTGVLVWTGEDELSVKHGVLIPDVSYRQTVQDRRRRFRKELEDQMNAIGWELVKMRRCMFFKRK
jgi:hypothetical protein